MQRCAVVLLLLLALAAACARTGSERTGGDPAAPTVNVTGSWAGTWASDDARFSGQCRFDLRQGVLGDDAKVTGVLLMTGVLPVQPSGYIDGVVRGDQFSFTRGAVSAALKVEGNTMRGPLVGLSSPTTAVLYRVGP